MELALATKEDRASSALTVATLRLLLLIALGYGISYIVPACISFASLQVNEEPRSSASVQSPGLQLHAALVCGSAPPRLWERSACNLPN
jgi:hypothetical protein